MWLWADFSCENKKGNDQLNKVLSTSYFSFMLISLFQFHSCLKITYWVTKENFKSVFGVKINRISTSSAIFDVMGVITDRRDAYLEAHIEI